MAIRKPGKPQLRAAIRVLLAGALLAAGTSTASTGEPTAAENHERMLRLLRIDDLRRGADGDPASPHAANYDESRANELMPTLPDPLIANDGRPVTDAETWWRQRRPEIVEHFEREIYGRVPETAPAVHWTVVDESRRSLGGVTVETRALNGRVDNSAAPGIEVAIALELAVPERSEGAVPVVLELGFDPAVLKGILARFSEAEIRAFNGGSRDGREQVVARGWAFAELVATSIQADSGDGLTQGVIGLANSGRQRNPEDWGALRAWAWGVSRAVDYFEQDPRIDAARVALEGHSRFGKAALVAMAFDQRIAAAYISSSGEGGAKLWRRNFGEQIGNIAGRGEFHWVAGNFLKYAGPLTAADLPVDAHHLLALCAPRPVFIGSGTEGDSWVDPKGMFLAARAAGPVYELLGRNGLGDAAYPPPGTALVAGDVAWRQHRYGHSPGPNWSHFLDFAERYFNAD